TAGSRPCASSWTGRTRGRAGPPPRATGERPRPAGRTRRRGGRDAMERSDPGAREEPLHQALLDYLESSERGPPPDVAELLRRHPEFAPELKDFLETQGQICDLTAPVRQVAQSLFRTARSGWPVTPGGGGAAPGAAVAAAPRSVGE